MIGSVVMILAGAVLRRRATRLSANEAPACEDTGFPDFFKGLVGASTEEMNDDPADHTTWNLYTPPYP
jgi:hypothetical protein